MRHFCLVYICYFPHHWIQFYWTLSVGIDVQSAVFTFFHFAWFIYLFVCFLVRGFAFETENKRVNIYDWSDNKKSMINFLPHCIDLIRNSNEPEKKINECRTVWLFLTNHSFELAFSSLKKTFSPAFSLVHFNQCPWNQETEQENESIQICRKNVLVFGND